MKTFTRALAATTLGCLTLVGCGNPALDEQVQVQSGAALNVNGASVQSRQVAARQVSPEALRALRAPRVMTEMVGHYSAATGRFTFERPDESGPSGGRPLGGYVALNSNTVSLRDNGTTIQGPGTFNSGQACASGQICAVVTLTNDSARQIDSPRVEIYNLTGGSLSGTNPLGTFYPSTAGAAGGYNYPSVAAGGSEAAPWIFNTSGGADFSFVVKVWGTYSRSAYSAGAQSNITANAVDNSGTWSDSTPAWRDACLFGTALASNTSSFQQVGVTPPFPFSFYDLLIDTDNATEALLMSSVGTVSLFGVDSSANTAMASSSPFTFAPFWDDDLRLTAGSMCVGVDPTSASPARRLVFTWKNAQLGSNANARLTFSLVLQEGTDRAYYLYNRWSNVSATCSASGSGGSQGSGATVGVIGNDGTQVTQVSLNSGTFLPAHLPTCPGTGRFVTLTATPANP